MILACRSQERGKQAEVDVRRESRSSNVHFHQLDLSSFASLNRFAEEILSEEARIDILINNAGVMYCPFGKTEDGFETHFGVNHLGHFLLTNLLLDKLLKVKSSRCLHWDMRWPQSLISIQSTRRHITADTMHTLRASWLMYCSLEHWPRG